MKFKNNGGERGDCAFKIGIILRRGSFYEQFVALLNYRQPNFTYITGGDFLKWRYISKR